jgi:hypothetical protein
MRNDIPVELLMTRLDLPIRNPVWNEPPARNWVRRLLYTIGWLAFLWFSAGFCARFTP